MRYSFVWAGVAIFSISLIIYYIYFLDVNECIVEKDDSEDYYVGSRQHNNSYKPQNLTQCPQINVTSLCSNFCSAILDTTNSTNNATHTTNTTNTNNTKDTTNNTNTTHTTSITNTTKTNNTKDTTNNTTNTNNHSTNPPNICVNTTIIEIKNESCSGEIGYVVPGVAVLIEPRSLQGIKNVTMNMMENLPKHWKIQIFTSLNNTAFVQTLLKKYYDSGKILIDNSILGNTTSLTREAYNSILVTEELWNKFIAEKVLIFQLDSIICKDSQRDIASFLQYDYIGAPWKNSTWAAVSNFIGNGGFSLRSRSKSIEVIKKYTRQGLNEDGYFARAMTELGANMPSYEEALQFSVERIFYPKPFGVHRFGYKRFTPDQQQQLLEYCPEINMMTLSDI